MRGQIVLPANIALAASELSATELRAAIGLARKPERGTQGFCDAGRDEIAALSGLGHPDTVSRGTNALAERGLLAIQRRPNAPSRYSWTDPDLTIEGVSGSDHRGGIRVPDLTIEGVSIIVDNTTDIDVSMSMTPKPLLESYPGAFEAIAALQSPSLKPYLSKAGLWRQEELLLALTRIERQTGWLPRADHFVAFLLQFVADPVDPEGRAIENFIGYTIGVMRRPGRQIPKETYIEKVSACWKQPPIERGTPEGRTIASRSPLARSIGEILGEMEGTG